MRKFLLASVATLGTVGLAFAQAPAGAPSQGQVAYPLANPTAYVNNNNNYAAPALPGALANPTPGTIVIHINGKVQTEFQAAWTSVDTRFSTATIAGQTSPGVVKLSPLALNEFARLYFGADAMATNGLRYGAAIEIRQNFTGQVASNQSSNASSMSSLSTLYVRRAFTYLAGENWGIVRLGMADGIIGIFDNGVTTGQFTIIGELNGGDTQNIPVAPPPFFFLSQAGNEYDVIKAVYLSPQIAGFDFGVQWAPNAQNGFGLTSSAGGLQSGLTGAALGTGLGCGPANSGCPTLSSGPGAFDGARFKNWTGIGVRYQGKFSDVGILAYAAYEFSGHTNYTGQGTNLTAAGRAILGTPVGGAYNGKYNGLSFGSGGIALTYAGFTLAGNIIGGRINGQLGLVPEGGSDEIAYTISAKYVNGPWTLGAVGEIGWFQGNPVLAGLSQRRGMALAVGAQYNVAPGLSLAAEYGYNDQKQSLNNFTSAPGFADSVHGQSFVLGSVVNF